MASAATVEILLGLPLLHLKIEAEAEAGIYRLNCNEQLRSKPLWYGHMNRAWDIMRELILQMGTGKMILIHVFHKPFTVRLPNRSEWGRGVVSLGKRGLKLLQGWIQDKQWHWGWGVWPQHQAEAQLQPAIIHHSVLGQSI